jgi:predicted nucleic acid-binding protein
MRARELLDKFFDDNERLVSDVEVLQEIIHHYTAINRRDAIQPAFDILMAIVDEFFPLDTEDLERAKGIVLMTSLSARDSLHLAVMRHRGVDRILTFDGDYDDVADITRLH